MLKHTQKLRILQIREEKLIQLSACNFYFIEGSMVLGVNCSPEEQYAF